MGEGKTEIRLWNLGPLQMRETVSREPASQQALELPISERLLEIAIDFPTPLYTSFMGKLKLKFVFKNQILLLSATALIEICGTEFSDSVW